MNALRALLVLAGALVLQSALGLLAPGAHRYVDVLLVPVVLCGVGASQRSAMIMGCTAGLLSDTWFHGGPFGLTGFKWTALGWWMGAVAGRIDLDQPAGRLVTGAALSAADDLLDVVVRGLLDAQPHVPGPLPIVVRAAATGLLSVAAGAMLERGRREQHAGRLA